MRRLDVRIACGVAAVFVVLFGGLPPAEAAVTFTEPQKLSDPGLWAEQGWSVAISGNRAIVGAPGSSGGRALVFDLVTGNQLYELRGSDTALNHRFGTVVAIDGDYAIVGANQHEAAYLFDLNTGQQIHKLVPDDPTYVLGFGNSVDISGNLAIVGAPQGGSGPYPYEHDYGSAFIFDVQTGEQLHRIDGQEFYSHLGSTVAIDGTTAVVGAPRWANRGKVYTYDALTGANLWTHQYTGGPTSDYFGTHVEIDGDLIAVAVTRSIYAMPMVYLLDRATGDIVNSFAPDIPVTNDGYKRDLDLSDGRVIVGSWGTYYEGIGYFVGDATVFDAYSGEPLFSFKRGDPATQDDFGFAVAIEGDRVLVGTPGYDNNHGMTFYYDAIPEPTAALVTLPAVLVMLCRGRQSI